MKSNIILFLGLLLLTFSSADAKPRKSLDTAPHEGANASHGKWLLSGGLGITISPTLFLISPQLETPVQRNILVGPLVQVGISDVVLTSISGAGRFLIGDHPKLKPSIEAGLGIAIASSYTSSVGVNVHVGMGVDYQIDHNLFLGTMLRANFAPPLKTFYLSWPIGVIRYLL